MPKNPLKFTLRAQLLIVMFAMMVLVVGIVVYLQDVAEEKMLDLVQQQMTNLTKAVEISVDNITAKGSTDRTRLQNAISELHKRGVAEVSILSNQQEVLLSSDPRKVGSRLSISPDEFLIQEKIGDYGDIKAKKEYSAFVPVISKGNLEGYINFIIYMDDLEKMSHDMLIQRLAWMLPVFGAGLIFLFFISHWYTKPIPQLIRAIQSISQGREPVLPRIPQVDISALGDSIGDMIKKLDERKILEEKLKRAEQQAMVAQLASGIAHEIRNPLNFIGLSLDHLGVLQSRESGGRNDAAMDLIQKTKAEIQRLNQMVANFLDLGRELVLHRIRFRLDLPVEEVLSTAGQVLKDRGISIERHYSAEIPSAKIDIDKMKSCIQNLILNAADAMPSGGVVRIAIGEQAGCAILAVEDTGQGIAPDDLARIFEPYFTTKRTGIGLGLAITKRVVEAHGGEIRVKSEAGKGSVFTVSIPM